MDRIRVNERSTKQIEFDILDEAGQAVPASALSEAALTLYDVNTGVFDGSPTLGILNNRESQDILNANEVTINASGHVVWAMQPADNAVVTPRRQLERHRAMFHFEWPDGEFNYEFEVEVMNLRMAG